MAFRNRMWGGCRTGPKHGMTPLSALSRRRLGPSSRLNDFPWELWFWHRVRLGLMSHTVLSRLLDPSAGFPRDWAVGRWCIFYHQELCAVCENYSEADLNCAVIGNRILQMSSKHSSFHSSLRFSFSFFLFLFFYNRLWLWHFWVLGDLWNFPSWGWRTGW